MNVLVERARWSLGFGGYTKLREGIICLVLPQDNYC
jgi:hypothetical protein